MDGYTDAEAKDIVGNRLQQRYWLRPGPSELYNGTTGPWFNGGVRLSLAFRPALSVQLFPVLGVVEAAGFLL